MVGSINALSKVRRYARIRKKRLDKFIRHSVQFRQRIRLARVLTRYLLKIVGQPEGHSYQVLQPAKVISLVRRLDRREIISNNLGKIPWLEWQFFDAYEDDNGALGCAMSHLQLIEEASANANANLAFLMEDDVEFLVGEDHLQELVDEFTRNRGIDVLCLGHWTVGPTFPISRSLEITASSLQTGCYLVKRRAFRSLAGYFKESVTRLTNGEPAREAAIDVVWLKAQRNELVFAIPSAAVAKQFESFSDISQTISSGEIPSKPKKASRY